MRTAGIAAIFVVLLTLVTTASADFELALDLRPAGGTGGTREVSNGVPLLSGQADDPSELHVLAPDGREIPAQFRVLARWWRQDNSIRWVLVSSAGSTTSPTRRSTSWSGERRAPPPRRRR